MGLTDSARLLVKKYSGGIIRRLGSIGQVLTMPLFFASNAIYPLSLMPE